MLLLDLEQHVQSLSSQDKLALIKFLEKNTLQDNAAISTVFPQAPDNYKIQTPWSFYEAYEVAANLNAWGKTLTGSKYLSPDQNIELESSDL